MLARILLASAQALRRSGDDQAAREPTQEAIGLLRQVAGHLQARSMRAELHRQLSELHAQQGQLDQAIVEARIVLTLRPGDPASHERLAALYERIGNERAALHQQRAERLRSQEPGATWSGNRRLDAAP